MKTLLAVTLLSLCTLASAQDHRPYIQEHSLVSGGTVVLTLNVGDLKILPSGSSHLRLEIQTQRPVDQETMAGWVRRFEVAGDHATIDIHIPKWEENCADDCGSNVTLYVPQPSDLKADLGVGDLSIQGVEGDKDLHTAVGDLRITVAGPAEYGHVETHTRIGDVHDSLNQKGEPDGFLGKSEDFTLGGRYHLRASTGIGDVHITEDGKP
jgi:hypothetical protein